MLQILLIILLKFNKIMFSGLKYTLQFIPSLFNQLSYLLVFSHILTTADTKKTCLNLKKGCIENNTFI